MWAAWRYRRAVRRALRTVGFYRDQCAAAGRLLDEPVPTPVGDLPDPPFLLCPVGRPYRPEREPSLWTPEHSALARVLRLAGRRGCAVLEVRDALLDRDHLAGVGQGPPWSGRARYGVLLGPRAVVASERHRRELNRGAGTGVAGQAGAVLVVGTAEELDDVLGGLGAIPVRAVRRGSPARALVDPAVELVHDPRLGYLGARVPTCRELHLAPRVLAELVDGHLVVSLPHRRRPVLLRMIPDDSAGLALARCPTHHATVLRPAGSSIAG